VAFRLVAEFAGLGRAELGDLGAGVVQAAVTWDGG
jgi:hypothetical protein